MENLENKKEDNSIDYEKELLKEKRKNYVLRLINTFCDTISVFLLTVLILFSVLCGYVLGAKGNDVVDDIYDKIQQEENSQRQESNRRLVNNNTPVPIEGYIENIYFNSFLSDLDILSTLESLDYIPLDSLGFDGYNANFVYINESLTIAFACVELPSLGIYAIVYLDLVEDISITYWDSIFGLYDVDDFFVSINDYNYLSVYAPQFNQVIQNDLVSGLISIDPFNSDESDEENIINVLFNAIYQGSIGIINPFVESIKLGFDTLVNGSYIGGIPLMQGDYVNNLYFNKDLSSTQINNFIDLVLINESWIYDTINTYYKNDFVYSNRNKIRPIVAQYLYEQIEKE